MSALTMRRRGVTPHPAAGGGSAAVTNLLLPGTSGNFPSAPDSTSLSPTGDLELWLWCQLPDWTPSVSDTTLAAKFLGAGTRSWRWYITNTNAMTIQWSATDGTTLLGGQDGHQSSAVLPAFTDGVTVAGLRMTFQANDGGGNHVVKYYTTTDAPDTASPTWTQLGVTRTIAGATSIFDSSTITEIGARNTGATDKMAANSRIYRFELRKTLGSGSPDAAFLPRTLTRTAARTPSTYTDASGNVWTVNGTGWDWSTT